MATKIHLNIRDAEPKLGLEDIFVWPDDTTCSREDAHQMNHMSDDYLVAYFGTLEWEIASDNAVESSVYDHIVDLRHK